MPPGQKGSFLDLLTALTSKLKDFPHSNRVIDTVHHIIYHPAKFRGSTPSKSNGQDVTGNLIFLKSFYCIPWRQTVKIFERKSKMMTMRKNSHKHMTIKL
jgi:hypothetical protein